MRCGAQPLSWLDSSEALRQDAAGSSGEGQMATVVETSETMSVGRVFSRGFGVIMHDPLTVFGIAFIVGALPSVILSFFQQQLMATRMDSDQVVGSVGLSLGSGLISVALQALV